MPFFFGRREGDRVVIEGDDARHLAGPLRARPGELIRVVHPPGSLLGVRLDTVAPARVSGTVVSEAPHHPEPGIEVTLALALLPAAGLELQLSRGTELGAARFVLVAAERSVARRDKSERWRTICREAAMLAGRLRVPEVSGPLAPAEALETAAGTAIILDAGGAEPLRPLTQPATLFVGPEGGWSDTERRLFAERGVELRSLGPRNLRADTAAAAALAIALSGSG